MSDDNGILRVDINGDPELRVEGAGQFQLPDYSIDPADKAIADAILAMDPVTDVAGPFSGLEGKINVEPKLTSLPTALREMVERQLVMVPASKRKESELQYVMAALKENGLRIRTETGVAGTSLPFFKVEAEIAIEGRDLANKFNANQAMLAEVRGHRTEHNDKGEPVAVPIFVYNGPRRDGILREQTELSYRMDLLSGIEGQMRLQKALKESVAVVKALEAQRADHAEVQRRAEEINRERSINERAELRARHLRSNV